MTLELSNRQDNTLSNIVGQKVQKHSRKDICISTDDIKLPYISTKKLRTKFALSIRLPNPLNTKHDPARVKPSDLYHSRNLTKLINAANTGTNSVKRGRSVTSEYLAHILSRKKPISNNERATLSLKKEEGHCISINPHLQMKDTHVRSSETTSTSARKETSSFTLRLHRYKGPEREVKTRCFTKANSPKAYLENGLPKISAIAQKRVKSIASRYKRNKVPLECSRSLTKPKISMHKRFNANIRFWPIADGSRILLADNRGGSPGILPFTHEVNASALY